MTIKTPWDEEIALFEAAERNGHLWDDARRVRIYKDLQSMAEGYRQGYAAAEARFVPLVEAAQKVLDWLVIIEYSYVVSGYGPIISALLDALARVKEAK